MGTIIFFELLQGDGPRATTSSKFEQVYQERVDSLEVPFRTTLKKPVTDFWSMFYPTNHASRISRLVEQHNDKLTRIGATG